MSDLYWNTMLFRDHHILSKRSWWLKVEWHFTKRLPGYRNLTYSDRLTKLALPSLELRRLHLDLIYCYKIIYCFWVCEIKFSDFFYFPHCPPTNFTGQEVVMSELFFACRVVNVWNSLSDTVGFTSLAVFKRCIRTVDFSEFLMCNNV